MYRTDGTPMLDAPAPTPQVFNHTLLLEHKPCSQHSSACEFNRILLLAHCQRQLQVETIVIRASNAQEGSAWLQALQLQLKSTKNE